MKTVYSKLNLTYLVTKRTTTFKKLYSIDKTITFRKSMESKDRRFVCHYRYDIIGFVVPCPSMRIYRIIDTYFHECAIVNCFTAFFDRT